MRYIQQNGILVPQTSRNRQRGFITCGPAFFGSPSSSGPTTGPRFWRINITATVAVYGTVQVAELELHATAGGSNQCSGGLAFASNTIQSGYDPSKAFDGSTATFWSSGVNAPVQVGYRLAIGTEINEIAIKTRTDAWSAVIANFCPKDFIVQSSTDSTTGIDGTWVDEWSIAGQTGWTEGQTRTFTRP